MPFATSIVPMPHWSTPLGCTKLFLTIVVLAFISACTTIWGWYPAFSITLFSATLSLLAFGYYMTALSFKPTLYNKWLVLTLETILTLQWFVSLILLAGWTGASSTIPRFYYNLSPYLTPYGGPYDTTTVNLSGRSLNRGGLLSHSWRPFGVWKRQDLDVPTTLVSVHGADARYAAQILAGISAGLAGMIFIMYAVTLATFTMNFHTDTITLDQRDHQSRPTTARGPNDEEMQMQPRTNQTTTNANTTMNDAAPTPASTQISSTTTVPSLAEPWNINSLPRDFEPNPQTYGYYLSPQEVTGAGIRPPTPVMGALSVDREREERKEAGVVEDESNADVVERGRTRTVTRGDGRVEREV